MTTAFPMHPDRRRVVLGAVASAVTLGGSSPPDPVYAAIATHKAAYIAFQDSFGSWDGFGDEPPTVTAAGGIEAHTCDVLAEIVPATLPGAMALCRYIVGYELGQHEWLRERHHDLFGNSDRFVSVLANLADCIACYVNGDTH